MTDGERAGEATGPEELTECDVNVFTYESIIGHYADAGWVWDEAQSTRTHPADPALHYRIDPVTQEIHLSAKLVEQVRAELERARRGGER